MSIRTANWALTLLVLVLPSLGHAQPPPATLVDDRGAPVDEPVELCAVRGTAASCVTVAPGAPVPALAPCDALRIEGPGHGPLRAARCEAPLGPEGARRWVVPRKAELALGAPPAGPVQLALFALEPPDFRRPDVTVDWHPAHFSSRVPAGRWVLALGARAAATELQVLELPPGSQHRLEFTPRPGGSVLLRVSDAEGRPLAGAQVVARGSLGLAQRQERQGTTDSAGLLALNALPGTFWVAHVAHAGFLAQEVPALVVPPGDFHFEPVMLPRGGSLEVTIRRGGEPAPGARCAVSDPRGQAAGSSGEGARFWGRTQADAAGRCFLEALPPGELVLQVTPEEAPASATVRTRVLIQEGVPTHAEFELAALDLSGRVSRGGEGLAGWRVLLYDLTEEGATARVHPVAETRSEETGVWSARLWAAGRYQLGLLDGLGHLVAAREVELSTSRDGLDFELPAQALTGVVVDGAGQPVSGARVLLRWGPRGGASGLVNSTQETDSDGTFELPLAVLPGEGTLAVFKPGYEPSPPQPLALGAEAAPPPFTLRLKRRAELTGVLRNPVGEPLVGAWVGSVSTVPGRRPTLVDTTGTSAEGRFTLATGTTLATAGPHCPLALHTVPASAEQPLLLTCPPGGVLVVELVAGSGADERPAAGQAVLLKVGGVAVPRELLSFHLSALRLPQATDSTGRLVLPFLAPGRYELFAADATSEAQLQAGAREGFLGSVEFAGEAVVRVRWGVGE